MSGELGWILFWLVVLFLGRMVNNEKNRMGNGPPKKREPWREGIEKWEKKKG